MKGFKPTGYGPKSGFAFNSKFGFTGSTGSVTSVAGYTRRKGYANGGFVKEGYQPKTQSAGDTGHATIQRNKPTTNLDQESGGRTPLRPGFNSGGKNWIQGAIKKPGALHRALGVPEGKKIPAKKLAKAARSDNPTMARRAALAKTLGKMHKADGGKVDLVKNAAKQLYEVFDTHTRSAVGKPYNSGPRATTRAEKLNQEYGAHRYTRRPMGGYKAKPAAEKTDTSKLEPLGTGPLEPDKYGDGGKVGMVKNLIKGAMGRMKSAPVAEAAKSATEAAPPKKFGVLDRRTGVRTDYEYKALRDANIERKNKLEGVTRYAPIDTDSTAQKARGGRC
jgi:hypothetical protein